MIAAAPQPAAAKSRISLPERFNIDSFKKIGWLIAEGLAAAGAMTVGLALVVFWRVSYAPLSLDALSGHAASAIESRLPAGYRVGLSGLSLQSGRGAAGARIVIEDLEIFDADGVRAFATRRATVRLSVEDLVQRRANPVVVAVTGVEIFLIRDETGRLSIGSGPAMRGGMGGELDARALLEAGALQRVAIEDVTFSFEDQRSGRLLYAPGLDIKVDRTGAGYAASWSGVLESEAGQARFVGSSLTGGENGVTSVSFRLDNAPSSEALAILFGRGAARALDAPVAIDAELVIDNEGRIDDAAVRAELGPGRSLAFGSPLDIRSGVLVARLNAETGDVAVDRLEVDAGDTFVDMRGAVTVLVREASALPAAVRFDLAFDRMGHVLPGVFEGPLSLGESRLAGSYDVDASALSLTQIELGLEEGRLGGVGGFQWARAEDGSPSPAVSLDLLFDGEMTPAEVLSYWPFVKGDAARGWVAENVRSGTIFDVRFAMDLEAGAYAAAGHMPDDALRLDFRIRNGVSTYMEGLPPLTDLAGEAVLRGNSFEMSADQARIGAITVSRGEIVLPQFRPIGAIATYGADAEGRIVDILRLLDREPIRVFSDTPLSPEDFGGRARGSFVLRSPLSADATNDDVTFEATADILAGSLQDVWQGAPLTDTLGRIEVDETGITLDGRAQLLGAEIDVVWSQSFEEGAETTRLAVEGVADPGAADGFGLATRSFLTGPARFEARGEGEKGLIDRLKIDLDLSDARLFVIGYDWEKPAGEPAKAFIDLKLGARTYSIESLTIEAADIDIDAAASFGENDELLAATANAFAIGDVIDGRLEASRDPQTMGLNASFKGRFFDAAPVLKWLTELEAGEESGLGAGFDLEIDADQLGLRGGAVLEEAQVRATHDGRRLVQAGVVGSFDGAPARIDLGRPDDTGEQALSVSSEDAGSLLQGVFEIPFVAGGALEVIGAVTQQSGERAPMITGAVAVTDPRIVDAPVIAQIFAAGSPLALDQLLSGEGIAIDEASGEFRLFGGQLTLYDAVATGPAIGLSLSGEIDYAKDFVNLGGAVAPVYAVNSALGRVPGVGKLFVSRRGEGVFALNYSVTGTVGRQTVAVNPLSALTPGVFRRLFETQR